MKKKVATLLPLGLTVEVVADDEDDDERNEMWSPR